MMIISDKGEFVYDCEIDDIIGGFGKCWPRQRDLRLIFNEDIILIVED